MERQLVIFNIGQESYGLDIAIVESISRMQSLTKVPCAAECVEGVTNLRGWILPVIDLRKRLGLVPVSATKETRIVVARANNTTVGVIVDSVAEVLRVPVDAIEPPASVDATFVSGIAKCGSRSIILLDFDKTLQINGAYLPATQQALPAAV